MNSSFAKRSPGRFFLVSLSVVVSVAISGCGPKGDMNRGSVGGNVTLDGTPVEQGTISFAPTAGTTGPAAYGTITGGEYTIEATERGPVVGKQQVKIEAYRETGEEDDSGPIVEQYIPAKYNTQTTLVVDIAEGQTSHDFELTSP